MSDTRLVPHESAAQAAIHTCWPAAADLWEENLEPARAEFAAFLKLLGEGEQALVIHAASAEAEASAKAAMGAGVTVLRNPYGDVWARDTGPVFALEKGQLVAVRFRFNGWGGKYALDGDQQIGLAIAARAGAQLREVDLVCEGGALEFDGEGSAITTRQCLLNLNRNPGLTETQVEDRLKEALGLEKLIWLDEGLVGDHTDGHIDNIARFIAPGIVACQVASGTDDPNSALYAAIIRQLESATDAKGRRLKVVRIPSPGLVADEEGEPQAASHMNWVIGPKKVIVPAYNRRVEAALTALKPYFAGRALAASPSLHILSGGGAFHCVTCNQPLV